MKVMAAVAIGFVLFASLDCDADKFAMPKGNFVRAIGNSVYLVNFEKGQNRLVYRFPVGTVVEGKIYQVDSTTILLSLPEEGKIVTLNLQTGMVEYLGNGLNPVYMDHHDKIIYFGKNNESLGALLVADRYLNNAKSIARSTSADPVTIVKISSDEVVFQMANQVERPYELWKYNVQSDALYKLQADPNCRLLNAWRSITKQLVCQKITINRFDTYYYLMDLDTTEEQPLTYDGYLNIGDYLPDLDALIVQRARADIGKREERSDLWLFRFSDQSSCPLMKNAGFAIDAFARMTESFAPANNSANGSIE